MTEIAWEDAVQGLCMAMSTVASDILYHFVFANEFSMYFKPDVLVDSKTFSILCKTCLGPRVKKE